MKHLNQVKGLLFAVCILLANTVFAAQKHHTQDELVPILTFKTSIYE